MKCFALEVVCRWVVDVLRIPISGFGRFVYPEFGKFVQFFVAKDAYMGSYFKDLGGVWVLCDLCENGYKKKMIKVALVCGRGFSVISKKEKETRLLMKIDVCLLGVKRWVLCE